MKRRKLLIALGAGLAMPLTPFAQERAKIRRIGFLAARSRSTPSNPDANYDAFVQGMHALDYVEGKNLAIEWRFADGKFDRLPALAVELVRLKPEVIVTHGTPATLAVQRATSTIPVVTAAVGSPVKSGFAESLARPGRNITGLSIITTDTLPKRIELLKIILPKVSRVAFLLNPTNSGNPAQLKPFIAAAERIGWKTVAVEASTPEEIARGFAAMAQAGVGAAVVSGDGLFVFHRQQIADLAKNHRIPTVHAYREDVVAGALISYGQNLTDYYRHTAIYVDKILKGANPGELPIEQPTKFHLAINLKTAKALGLSVPKELLFRADEVIE